MCRWLKVQSLLKNYHENLQLALEVSSFYQQADNTLFAINNMVKFSGSLIVYHPVRSEIHIEIPLLIRILSFRRKAYLPPKSWTASETGKYVTLPVKSW